MGGWTRLYEKSTSSLHLSDLIDEEPEAYVLFTLMVAAAGVWGRFSANPKMLKSKVAPLCDRLSAARIVELLPLLEKPFADDDQYGLVRRYQVGGQEYLCITKHFVYNGKQSWHRVSRPDIPNPQDWLPPNELIAYLCKVRDEKFEKKSLGVECEKFGILPESLPTADQQLLWSDPQDPSTGPLPTRAQTSDFRRETSDVRRETTDEEKEGLPPAAPPDPESRPESPAQTAANACLAVWGLKHEQLIGPSKASYYKAMNALMAVLEHGADELQFWAERELSSGKRELGNGSKPEKSIPQVVRGEVQAKVNQARFAKAREGNNGSAGTSRNSGRIMGPMSEEAFGEIEPRPE